MIYNYNTQPFIVINGISSRTIKGLIISKLPPISKPAIRTKTETVDGRDGDIVTALGYSAYNKTLEIGLSYEYDIDDIIAFFDSMGKVTFSNEPEKYYNYAIYAQIDYEKLLRFKTATVTFHVQPFKFSDLEGVKVFSDLSLQTVNINNNGNIFSRPKITITGKGTVTLSINGTQYLSIALPNSDTSIAIDAYGFNAYNPLTGAFLNRLVTGNYDNIRLKPGRNTLRITGAVTEVKIENYSRWI